MLTKLRDEGRTAVFPEMVGSLWTTMKTGGFSPILLGPILVTPEEAKALGLGAIAGLDRHIRPYLMAGISTGIRATSWSSIYSVFRSMR